MKKIYILVFAILLLGGCGLTGVKNTQKNLDSIEISITDTSELENETYYTLEMTNNSNRTMKYVELEFGFGLSSEAKKEGIYTELMFRGEAQDKPYDIKSGRSEMFRVRVPVALLKEDRIDKKDIIISVSGYYDELKDKNRFKKSGNLSYFITDYK